MLDRSTAAALVLVAALPARAEPSTSAACPPGLVRIPAGRFVPGLDDGPVRLPAPPVEVDAFCMGATELTQADWSKVMPSNPSEFKEPNLPVEQINWFDAVAYCNARSAAEGLTPAYQVSGASVRFDRASLGYRLPTEVEWEYAARAGSTERRYGPLEQTAWIPGRSAGRPQPVATLQPNAWGLYDVLGNVWEWVGDRPGGDDDPSASGWSKFRVLRGGAWHFGARRLRAAYRTDYSPEGRFPSLGVRIARSLPAETKSSKAIRSK
jgi:sulfatase modifying factor 1